MEELFLKFLAGTVGPLIARHGLAAARSRFAQDPVLAEAARSTATQFPNLPGLEDALHEWSRDGQFLELTESISHATQPDAAELARTFNDIAAFFSGSTSSRQDAEDVLKVFFEEITRRLYDGSDGHAVMMARLEQMNTDVSSRLDELKFDELQAYAALSRWAPQTPDAAAIRAFIDVGRLEVIETLLDEGRQRTAQRFVDRLRREGIGNSEDREVQVRLASIDGRLALGDGRPNDAVHPFEAAHALVPDRVLAKLRLALALSESGARDAAGDLWTQIDADSDFSERELANVATLSSNLDQLDVAEQILSKHLHLKHRPRVAIAFGAELAKRDQYDDALALLREARAGVAEQHVGLELLYGHVLSAKAGRQVDDEDLSGAIKTAREAADVLGAIEEWAPSWEKGEARLEFRIAHARALGLLGRWASSVRQCDAALQEFPGTIEARLYRARALAALGRVDEVLSTLEQFPTENAEAYRAAMLTRSDAEYRKGHFSQALQSALKSVAWEQPGYFELDLVIRSSDAMGMDTGESLLLALVAREQPVASAAIVLARRLSRDGRADEAAAFLDPWTRSHNLIPQADLYAFCATLHAAGRFNDAISLLESRTEEGPDDPAAGLMLRSLYLAGRVEDAVTLASQMLETDIGREDAAEVLSAIADASGDVNRALQFTEVLARLRPNDAAVRHTELLDLLRLGREEDARLLLRSLRPLEMMGPALRLLDLAGTAFLLGDREAARSLAYRGRRLGDDQPEVHLKYIGLLLQIAPEEEAPTRVQVGTGVELRSDAGSSIDLVILDWGEEPLDELELSPASRLAGVLLGREVGDVLEDPSPLMTGRWRIAEVRSKYGFMARVTFRYFERRFGPDAGLTSVPFSSDDPSAVLGQLDVRAEYVGRVLDEYDKWRLPLATFAEMIGVDRSQLWLTAARSSGAELAVRFQSSTHDLLRTASELVGWTGPLVIDVAAVRTMSELGVTESLLAEYPRLLVPQAVLDRLLEESLRSRTMEAEPATMGRAQDGTYFMTERNEDAMAERRQVLERALATGRRFEVAPLPLPSTGSDRARDLRLIGSDNHAAIHLAAAIGARLLTDDAAVAALAQNELGVSSWSSQAILIALCQRGAIDEYQYRDLVGRLAALGYRNILLTVADFTWLVSGNDRATWFGAFAQLQEGACDRTVAVRIAAATLRVAALNASLADSMNDIILDACWWLTRSRDSAVLDELDREIRTSKGLYVGDAAELATCVQSVTEDLRRALDDASREVLTGRSKEEVGPRVETV